MRALPSVLLALVLGPGCFSASWERVVIQTVPDEAVFASLAPGETDLTRALAALGAPIFVYEHVDGIALAYGWQKSRIWSVSVDVPVAKEFSGSLRYADLEDGLEGLLLLFDASDRLTTMRRGVLRDLEAMIPQSRQVVDDETD